MTEVQKRLFELRDEKYAAFQAKLTPGIPEEKMIGVRIPLLRKFAKEFAKEPGAAAFLQVLPHEYYDEDMLHCLLISCMKDYDTCVSEIERFLPYVNNWAVCDIMSPKVLKKRLPETMERIRKWSASEETYTCRFGVEMLMSFYLDEHFEPEYLEIPAAIQSEEYYVNMMLAWFFATALAKQWDATIPYLTENRLGDWVHNKTIQKAVESYRISDEQKIYLKSIRRK